jgi:acrylyl-CoA reductase (NADPH)
MNIQMDSVFNALLITEQNGSYLKEIKELRTSQLPQNELLIKVCYSSVNYKDALSASGNRSITRRYPHVPGVDAAGIVVKSNSQSFTQGDEVVVTGFDLGMNTWGGFAQYISIPAQWAMHLPKGLSLKEVMCYGTAGLTAGLSVYRLLDAGINPTKGPVAVSGATGGVGSIAIAILRKLGFEVVAISGKNSQDYLSNVLGANKIIDREQFIQTYNTKTLNSSVFAAGIDTCGGPILSGMLKSTNYGGTVTCCGMLAAHDISTSIFPFILRGVSLAGIDSVKVPLDMRKQVWQLLATGWKPDNLDALTQEIRLNELPGILDKLLQGQAKGRYVLVHDVL